MAAISLKTIEELKQAALAELLDDGAAREYGSRDEAAFRIALALGLTDGDDVELVGDDAVELGMSIDQIRGRVQLALQLKRGGGLPTADVLARVDG